MKKITPCSNKKNMLKILYNSNSNSKLMFKKPTFNFLGSLVMTAGMIFSVAVPAYAAPTVTPASAIDSSTNPIYALDQTSCLEVFNWSKYLADVNNGITNSNPYDQKDCVVQNNIAYNGTRTITKDNSAKPTNITYNVGARQFAKTKYADFAIGQASTKTAFGNLEVLGVFPNGSRNAQALNAYDVDGTQRGSVAPVDRSVKEGLSSTFTTAQLNTLYSTGGTREGMPRICYTGPDIFQNDLWIGGFCKVEGGKFKAKVIGPDKNGDTWTVSDYGEDPNSMITTGRWPQNSDTVAKGLYDPEGVVKDQNLGVYQFVYKIPFPKDKAECDSWFPKAFSEYEKCLSWFQERYSLPLAGTKSGNAVCYTYTYYGAFDDKYTQFVGWNNPDIGKARSTFTSSATLDQLRKYYQDPEDILRSLFGDTTSSYGALRNKMDTSSDTIKNQYKDALKQKFEGYIRNADGYSVYTC
jgi:hypothetical protein